MFLGVTGMLLHMPYVEEERRTIAGVVREARIARRLDKEPASRAAEVSSITWKRVEDGESVRDASLSKILASLDLPPAAEILSTDTHVEPPAAAETKPRLRDHPYLNRCSVLWASVADLAEEVVATDQPQVVRDKTRWVVTVAVDVLSDILVVSPDAAVSKDLLKDMFERSMQLRAELEPNERKDDDLEAAQESDAPSEAHQIEKTDEPSVDQVGLKRMAPGKYSRKKQATVRGDEDGHQDQELGG